MLTRIQQATEPDSRLLPNLMGLVEIQPHDSFRLLAMAIVTRIDFFNNDALP